MASKKGFDLKCGKTGLVRGRGEALVWTWNEPWLSNKNEPAEGGEHSEQTIGLLSEWWVKIDRVRKVFDNTYGFGLQTLPIMCPSVKAAECGTD